MAASRPPCWLIFLACLLRAASRVVSRVFATCSHGVSSSRSVMFLPPTARVLAGGLAVAALIDQVDDRPDAAANLGHVLAESRHVLAESRHVLAEFRHVPAEFPECGGV